MKLSNMLIAAVLVLSFNNITHATEQTKTKSISKNCPTQMVTSADLIYESIVPENTDLGKLYKDYVAQVKTLPTAGHFKQFKIVDQRLHVANASRSSENKGITISLTIDFDLNYEAITELSALNTTSMAVSTYERKRC